MSLDISIIWLKSLNLCHLRSLPHILFWFYKHIYLSNLLYIWWSWCPFALFISILCRFANCKSYKFQRLFSKSFFYIYFWLYELTYQWQVKSLKMLKLDSVLCLYIWFYKQENLLKSQIFLFCWLCFWFLFRLFIYFWFYKSKNY